MGGPQRRWSDGRTVRHHAALSACLVALALCCTAPAATQPVTQTILADSAATMANSLVGSVDDSAARPAAPTAAGPAVNNRPAPPLKPSQQHPMALDLTERSPSVSANAPPGKNPTPPSAAATPAANAPAAKAAVAPGPEAPPTARQYGDPDTPDGPPKPPNGTCSNPIAVQQYNISDPKAPKSFIFNSLSAREVLQTQAYVTAALELFKETDKNPDPATNQDFVVEVELLDPPKAAALAWLDGTAAAPPPRFARVTTIRGSKGDCMDYKVGPLDRLTSAKEISDVLQALTRPGQIPWAKRPRSDAGGTWLGQVFGPTLATLRPILEDFGESTCFAAVAKAGPNQIPAPCAGWNGYGILPYPILSDNTTQRLTYVKFFLNALNGDEQNLFSAPITAQIDESSTNISEWKQLNFIYCSQGPYESAAALVKAFEAGDLKKCNSPGWGKPAYNFSWATTDPLPPPQSAADLTAANPALGGGLQVSDLGTVLPGGRPLAGARTFMPQGSRVTVQTSNTSTGAAFQWLEWAGHMSLRPVSGISLWDISFRGQRIAYELSLQELFIAYNSYSGAGATYFLDSYYGIGIDSLPLRVGYDCPNHAVYLDAAVVLDPSTAAITPNAVCIFEADMSQTAWRHSNSDGAKGPHLDAGRAVELVVRAIATVGNYDYQTDVRFHTDGSMTVAVQAGGFMETLYWQFPQTAGDLPFGTVVGKNIFAPLHDHLSGWKVDLDILGTDNTFTSQTVKVGTYEEALKAQSGADNRGGQTVDAAKVPPVRPVWFSDAPDVIKYVATSTPGKEAGYVLNLTAPSVWQFMAGSNATGGSATNAFGQQRGYAIAPTGWQTQQLLPPTHPLTKAASWTKYHLAVTKQRDNETRSSASRFDNYVPAVPFVSLDTFLDGDSTVDTDLVAWVMAGVQHIPRSEDVPVVSNFGSSFAIKPWNFWNELPSRVVYDDPKFEQCAPTTQGNNAAWPPPDTAF